MGISPLRVVGVRANLHFMNTNLIEGSYEECRKLLG